MKNDKNLNDVKDGVNKFAQDMEGKQLEISGKKFSYIQIGLILGAVLEIIGCFLPFIEGGASVAGVSVSSSTNYISSGGDFIVILGALVATIALTFLGKQQFSIITAILNIAWIVYDAFISGGDAREYMTVCIGAYVMVVAALIVVVTAGLGMINAEKKR